MAHDVAVVGGGPGGYVCAIRAAQLGFSVALIESRETLGGTCLNVGCIPSKALLHASHSYVDARERFVEMGVGSGQIDLDLDRMQGYKDAQVKELTEGIGLLLRKNKIEHIHGHARLLGPGRLEVSSPEGGPSVLEAGRIVLATGSEPSALAGVAVDEERIVTSTGALALEKVPDRLIVIGGGVIGLELGSVWARLGAAVTVIEYLEEIASGADLEVARMLRRILSRQGLSFELGSAVQGATQDGGQVSVQHQSREGGSEQSLAADIVLVATGRRACTDGLGAEEAGLALDRQGRIQIDGQWKTSLEGVHAIGDVVSGPMLAHKAEDEGIAVAEILAGQHGHVRQDLIPSVIYTEPEVSWVGSTEEQLKEQGRAYRAGKFPFAANARAKSIGARLGFAKILADEASDEILGMHVIGPQAGELIHEACVAMEFGASAEDLARTCHAHPTLSEAMREAALAAGSGAIHS